MMLGVTVRSALLVLSLGSALSAANLPLSLSSRKSALNARLQSSSGSQFQIPSPLRLSGGGKKAAAGGKKILDVFDHEINSKHEGQSGNIHVEVWKEAGNIVCEISSTVPGQAWMHWGFAKRDTGWFTPPDQFLPPDTKKIDDKASQSPFKNGKILVTVPEKEAPEALAFVLKKDSPEEWFNGPGGDFWIAFKPMDPDGIGTLIVERESKSSHWSILNRMQLVCENIKAVAESPGGCAWIYTLLRFNQMKLVPLTTNSNYQSKDLAHTQKGVSLALAALYGRYPAARVWARMCITIVPRGGGNGDAIRLEILDIMRRHGIKEGHRPGIEDKFIEEWHQKLHTNCAPDDIVIAEAYINFLQSGNPDDYWNHLKGNGLSWEYMCSIGGGKGSANSGLKGLTATPMHLPQLTDDIKHLRWTLMQVHGGADLDFMIHKAAPGLDGELNGILGEIQHNRHEWWIPGKIMEARRKLAGYLQNEAGHRDALMLDVTLEQWFKINIEKTNFGDCDRGALLDLAALVLENTALSYGEEFWPCLNQLNHLKSEGDQWSETWAKKGKATVERITLALQRQMDEIYTLVQPKAERLGKAMNNDQAYITNFGEEVVRGLPSFCLSQILACLDPQMRVAGNLGVWEQVSSESSGSGEIQVMEDMVAIQGKKNFDSPQVLIVKTIGGIEDIPPGVSAILTRSGMDVLSHIAIRARNQGVLLATCHDDGEFDKLTKLSGAVTATVNAAGDVEVKAGLSGAAAASSKAPKAAKISLRQLTPASKMVVTDAEFTGDILGGKSNNLQALRKATGLPAFLKFPSSVALPFGTCEKVMAGAANTQTTARINALTTKLCGDPAKDQEVLAEIRDAFDELEMVDGLEKELVGACKTAGFSAELTEDVDECFDAVKKVWGSKWGDRAYFSRKACSVDDRSLYMGVLVQQVVPAQYSFVLHTENPISGSKDEIMGELVVGLGEALVGNYPGRALSFVMNKKTGDITVSRFPSKRAGVFLADSTLIFRSDSNGEDLEGFAGAGLYESVMATPAKESPVDYNENKIMWDEGFRNAILDKLLTVGKAVEGAMTGPQDIEGCVVDDDVYVVQTRPQV
eukprot:CAMPEP_0181291048 /NCGR_PEP_ID=MMETSP1101-20121128/1749_1 /TAXON_ID=46948 /ORGANISM="Rhodomonas abbreviata, Strain Caron Lab Isolate" /LENGTH=1087 /DNA_ID=CAMNT_0023395393 /DNA_START=89 /DNA_END=3353 /DNA_ORIENTATION=+